VEIAQIANVLGEIADLLELTGANAFRVRSYRSAPGTAGEEKRAENTRAHGAA
jgi:DNA polymerase/3'-5' exonuclease PolX